MQGKVLCCTAQEAWEHYVGHFRYSCDFSTLMFSAGCLWSQSVKVQHHQQRWSSDSGDWLQDTSVFCRFVYIFHLPCTSYLTYLKQCTLVESIEMKDLHQTNYRWTVSDDIGTAIYITSYVCIWKKYIFAFIATKSTQEKVHMLLYCPRQTFVPLEDENENVQQWTQSTCATPVPILPLPKALKFHVHLDYIKMPSYINPFCDWPEGGSMASIYFDSPLHPY